MVGFLDEEIFVYILHRRKCKRYSLPLRPRRRFYFPAYGILTLSHRNHNNFPLSNGSFFIALCMTGYVIKRLIPHPRLVLDESFMDQMRVDTSPAFRCYPQHLAKSLVVFYLLPSLHSIMKEGFKVSYRILDLFLWCARMQG